MIMDWMWTLVIGLIGLAFIFTVIRLIRGPRLPDRVVALDLITAEIIGVIAVASVRANQPAFLDVAIILALISFLGTVAFAYYIEQRV
ncbi:MULTISPECIES: monovalent cation/H+ antiporter complex subunit F [Anaerolinea]|uniref:Na(+)/H(+) antiporter subunit F n=1 Tax=Anaerolinea thermophila (strain DSM 14523 / JCM 11388 / NBRC 100420 / UNI-1) TaxID=926569 RepID=E8N1M7_ANATU|nr:MULTISPECIES: cation:proton antiporter [Anaerolinea]BAJ62632.1 Na(+)/H(+) antiporter subunit F [Anaerolinea thermophila UNI-1]